MQWSEEQIGWLTDLELGSQRSGYVEEPVETMRQHLVACMRAGRQIPDPAAFALPIRTFGVGYARSEVDALVGVLREWHLDAADKEPTPGASPSPTEPAPAEPYDRRTPTPLHWTHAQIDWVRDRRFRTRRSGYDQGDVDDFLDAVIVAMAHGRRLPDVEGAMFTTSGIRQGYEFAEVDRFLDELLRLRPDPA